MNIVDINNHSPVFGQPLYTFHVAENDLTAEMGQLVGRVTATDGDSGENGRISYFITARSDSALFDIPEVGFDLCQIYRLHFDGLVQERCSSIAVAMELRLSGTNPLILQMILC